MIPEMIHDTRMWHVSRSLHFTSILSVIPHTWTFKKSTFLWKRFALNLAVLQNMAVTAEQEYICLKLYFRPNTTSFVLAVRQDCMSSLVIFSRLQFITVLQYILLLPVFEPPGSETLQWETYAFLWHLSSLTDCWGLECSQVQTPFL